MKSAKQARQPSYDSRKIRGNPSIDSLGNFTASDANGRRMLEGKNLVVLAITTFNIDKFAWGFDRLVARLYGDPDEKQTPFEEVEVKGVENGP